MAKSSDNIRCIRKHPKKDSTFSFHAEVRRKGAKPLRQVFDTLTKAKNWVRSTESDILQGKLPQEIKARKYTVNDLIEQYEMIYLSRFPKRVRSQVHHLICSYNAWKNPSQITLIQTLIDTGKPVILISTRDPLDAALLSDADLVSTSLSPTVPSIQAICDQLVEKYK